MMDVIGKVVMIQSILPITKVCYCHKSLLKQSEFKLYFRNPVCFKFDVTKPEQSV